LCYGSFVFVLPRRPPGSPLLPYTTLFRSALNAAGIRVSLFIEPDPVQLDAAKALGAPVVELHTGAYCDAGPATQAAQLQRVKDAAAHAEAIGLECHAGHGLTFDTVGPVAAIATIAELNIGHFLIGEAIFMGLDPAVREMRRLMDDARAGTCMWSC